MVTTAEKRFGLILRVFAKKPEQVRAEAQETADTARQAASITVDGRRLFEEIKIVVASDTNRIDYDCGETAPLLEEMLAGVAGVEVHELLHGDLFCGALNYGIESLAKSGIEYAVILSHRARRYLTSPLLEEARAAFGQGAQVVGIAIGGLRKSVLEGRIANTFAIWDIRALRAVGGFDLRAAQPQRSDKKALYLREWNARKGEFLYPLAGVEEIIPAIRLVEKYGPCIVVIIPPEPLPAQPLPDTEDGVRHDEEMETKLERQVALAASIGADLSILKRGVLAPPKQKSRDVI